MTQLRLAMTFLILAGIAFLLIPFAFAKVLAGLFAILFVIFLIVGLSRLDSLTA